MKTNLLIGFSQDPSALRNVEIWNEFTQSLKDVCTRSEEHVIQWIRGQWGS